MKKYWKFITLSNNSLRLYAKGLQNIRMYTDKKITDIPATASLTTLIRMAIF